MKTVLDNLIHRLEIPDMIVALTDSPDRLREYAERRAPRAVPHRRAGAAPRARASRSTTARRRAA